MCGIAGFFVSQPRFSHSDHQGFLDAMTHVLAHRGPDAQGVWSDAEGGVYLGHRRLSILDLSEAGAQPMTSHCGRYVMVYNGEVYNTDHLASALRAERPDIAFRGHSDTEILLEGFATLGRDKTLSLIKGMFAIALWDRQDRSLHFMRDHLGKKPLYIGWVGGYIAFASELKAIESLARSVGASLHIDHDAFDAYRYFGFVPAPGCIYKHIFKILPAHSLTLTADDLQSKGVDVPVQNQKRYWSLRKSADLLSAEEWRAKLKTSLCDAVAQRMMSDVPLGAFLSGGIDSSLVSALMQTQSSKPIKTYSIGFYDDAFDESRHAEKIASHLKTDHTTYMATPADGLALVERLSDIYDEPFADYSQIPTVLLCQKARQDTVVALSGDGGDEGFCGYKRYFMLKRLLDATHKIPHGLRVMIARIATMPSQGAYNRFGLNGKRLHSIAGFLQEGNFDSAVLRALSIAPWLDCPDGLQLGQSDDVNDLERMMMIDAHLYLPDDILVKVDRASMFSSLEVRSPLLDKDVLELAWQIPIEDKVFECGRMGKKPLYDLLCNYVPQDLIDRPKQGFTPPIAQWLRGDLREWADDLIHAQTPLFDSSDIVLLWKDFLSGRVDHHVAIWSILMAQSWYISRKF